MKKVVYFDNNATTMVAPEVIEAMQPYWSKLYGNPSSIHSFGGEVRKDVEKAREQVAALLGAKAGEIVFTGGGSESDNMAILCALEAAGPEKKHVITTKVEHHAVLKVCDYLKTKGYRVTELDVNIDGALDLDQLDRSITINTALVSIMWANNETGVISPIEKIVEIVKSKGVLFHTDAVQAVGKIPLDLSKIPVDFLAASGHKLHAPKGIGVLFVREGVDLPPLIHGGHQEGGRRAGTENVPAIIGFGKAAEIALEHMDEKNERVRRMREKFETGILSRCKGTRINGRNRLPNTSNITFGYVEGEAVLLMLDDLGICASSGSACTSGSLEPSHVLKAMGLDESSIYSSIRFSISRYTTQEEIDYALEHIPQIIKRLREMSPFTQVFS
ncbi:MAG TPA: cysteine desulfurase NifS [archaeon]|nr:cysteine desulfurase NifS [archaeon]